MGVFVDDFGRMDADRSKTQFRVFEVSKSGDVRTSKKGIGYTVCSMVHKLHFFHSCCAVF